MMTMFTEIIPSLLLKVFENIFNNFFTVENLEIHNILDSMKL